MGLTAWAYRQRVSADRIHELRDIKGKSDKVELEDRTEFFEYLNGILDIYKTIPKRISEYDRRNWLHDIVHNVLNNDYSFTGGDTIKYLCHYPSRPSVLESLCGCEGTKHTAWNALHFTLLSCDDATFVCCIDYRTGEMVAHRIGECPLSRYKIKETK